MDSAYSPPTLMGESEGETFEEACRNFFVRPDDKQYYDPVRNTYWSLKLAPRLGDLELE